MFYYRMTRAGGLHPRTPEDGSKDDDDELIIEDDEASQESISNPEEMEVADKRRANRKRIRRNSALTLVVYGFVTMVVCLTINILVGGGH